MSPQQRNNAYENGARAAAIGMTIIVIAAMVIALLGWHPWTGGM